MKINIQQIKNTIGSQLQFKFTTSTSGLAMDEQSLWSGSAIEVIGNVVNTGRYMDVSGTISATVTYTCVRCLEDFTRNLIIPFEEQYADKDVVIDCGDDEQANIFNGEHIDITDLIRDTLLLAEEVQPLCSEHCSGLCSRCGVNLNYEHCSCPSNIIDPRLAALEHLLHNRD